MNVTRLIQLGLTLAVLATGAGQAHAHNPLCLCETSDGEEIRCKGGFSDGSGAPGVTIDVISYEEEILIPGKLGDDSSVSFQRPDQEFYILFDAGPGHVVEVDHTEIPVQ